MGGGSGFGVGREPPTETSFEGDHASASTRSASAAENDTARFAVRVAKMTRVSVS